MEEETKTLRRKYINNARKTALFNLEHGEFYFAAHDMEQVKTLKVELANLELALFRHNMEKSKLFTEKVACSPVISQDDF
jgi:hypothetical protein